MTTSAHPSAPYDEDITPVPEEPACLADDLKLFAGAWAAGFVFFLLLIW